MKNLSDLFSTEDKDLAILQLCINLNNVLFNFKPYDGYTLDDIIDNYNHDNGFNIMETLSNLEPKILSFYKDRFTPRLSELCDKETLNMNDLRDVDSELFSILDVKSGNNPKNLLIYHALTGIIFKKFKRQ